MPQKANLWKQNKAIHGTVTLIQEIRQDDLRVLMVSSGMKYSMEKL